MSAIALRPPAGPAVPLVVTVPHAGTLVPADVAATLIAGPAVLRTLQDPWVDRLAEGAAGAGAWTLHTAWARAVADVNRAPNELDPAGLADGPTLGWQASTKARAGLGVVPTQVAGRPLYRGPLAVAEVERRLALAHRPYHERLAELLDTLTARFGEVLVLDLHSMPETAQLGGAAVDVALGDRYGRTADACWVSLLADALAAAGLEVGRNRPYAGGYLAELHGRPKAGVHVIQIEFRRGLYMDETAFATHEGLGRLASVCTDTFRRLARALEDGAAGRVAVAGE